MLLRARVAALTIVLAPSLAVAADVLASRDAFPSSSLARLSEFAAWFPAIATLEHFLKRRSEAGSLLCAAIATLGAFAGVVDASFALFDTAPNPMWLGAAARRGALLLPTGVALFGLGYARRRVAPRWVCGLLAVGGIAATIAGSIASNTWELASDVLILVAHVAIASRIARSANVWREAELWPAR